MPSRTKQFYIVSYIPPDQKGVTHNVENGQILLEHTLCAKSAQNAVRLAVRNWLRTGKIKRQPRTDDAGEFIGVELELL